MPEPKLLNWSCRPSSRLMSVLMNLDCPQMRGIMMAKKKPIDVMDLAALGTSLDEVGGAGPKVGNS